MELKGKYNIAKIYTDNIEEIAVAQIQKSFEPSCIFGYKDKYNA